MRNKNKIKFCQFEFTTCKTQQTRKNENLRDNDEKYDEFYNDENKRREF